MNSIADWFHPPADSAWNLLLQPGTRALSPQTSTQGISRRVFGAGTAVALSTWPPRNTTFRFYLTSRATEAFLGDALCMGLSMTIIKSSQTWPVGPRSEEHTSEL